MKIGTKLTLFLTLPLIALMVLFGYLSQRASHARLHGEMMREGRGIALTARVALEDYLRDGQMEDIRELVEQMSGYERVLGMRVFAPDGSVTVQSHSLNTYPFDQKADLSRVLHTLTSSESSGILGGEPVVRFLLPLTGSDGHLQGAAQIYLLETYIREESLATRNFLAALTVVMILGAGTTVLTVTHWSVSRPIDALVHSFREVGTGGKVARVVVRRGDELGRLASEFNTMCGRLEATRDSLQVEQSERRRVEDRLRNVEPLVSLGRLSAGLAHEIGTPLNVIAGRAESLLRKLSGNEIAEKNLKIMVTQIDRIARIVPRLLDSARARESRMAPTQVVRVVRRVLEFLAERMEETGVEVESALPAESLPVQADPDQIYEVFLNLATNALDAMPRGGTLRVRAESRPSMPPGPWAGGARYLAITVEDTGTGIAREHLERIFDPFFTTKEAGRGTGLGLSVSHGIVRRHGGWIEVESQEGRGTCFTVCLPVQVSQVLAATAEGAGA